MIYSASSLGDIYIQRWRVRGGCIFCRITGHLFSLTGRLLPVFSVEKP